MTDNDIPDTAKPLSMLRQHEITLRVRYKETDPMGFLHHANYFVYFEIGRTELLRASGGNYRQMEEAGLLVVVVKAECRFRRPARYDDVLTLRTTITRVTQAKIEHQYDLFRDGESLATGFVTLAVVDRTGKVQPVPEWMQEAMSE
jgi:acyl-CoA thioester hydrolase